MLKGLGARLVEKENGAARQLHGGFCKGPELPASWESGGEDLCVREGAVLFFSILPPVFNVFVDTRPPCWSLVSLSCSVVLAEGLSLLENGTTFCSPGSVVGNRDSMVSAFRAYVFRRNLYSGGNRCNE